MDAKTAITLRQKARRNAGYAGQRRRAGSPSGPVGRRATAGTEDPFYGPGPAVAGGQFPYHECGPCQMNHCLACGVPNGEYAGSPFPPTCDCEAPCMAQNTCTPCEGPQRGQRWGNQYMPDDFGGRMCFRPCPPDPCCPEIPPPPPPPPNGGPPDIDIPPPPPPNGEPPGIIETPPCPPMADCCAVIEGNKVYLECLPANHPWNGMDVTGFAKCVSTGPGAETMCSIEWIEECGEIRLVVPICYEPPPPPPPRIPPVIRIPPPNGCPPGTTCCVVRVANSTVGGTRFILKCEDANHPWNGKDVTQYTTCYAQNGATVCEVKWVDQCGEHWLEAPVCEPSGRPTIPAVIQAAVTPKCSPGWYWHEDTQQCIRPEPMMPGGGLASTLAFAGRSAVSPRRGAVAGRVRSPSNGVGRR